LGGLNQNAEQQRRQHQTKQTADNPATDILGINRAPYRLRCGSHADSFNAMVGRVTPQINSIPKPVRSAVG